jgi:hypothetical protein
MISGGTKYKPSFMTVGLKHSNLIEVITTTSLEAAVFVPLMGGIYEVHC